MFSESIFKCFFFVINVKRLFAETWYSLYKSIYFDQENKYLLETPCIIYDKERLPLGGYV